MPKLTGLTALVTGGNRGLGYAMAQRLLHDGADVLIVGRNADSVHECGQEPVRARPRDRCRRGRRHRQTGCAICSPSVDEFSPRLDILVNNAGIADEAAFGDITRDNWERVIAINLSAPFFLSQAAATRMTQGGAIVNITSIDAYGADGPFSSYVAAKAGSIGLTKAAAVELAPRGIRVNAVSPGWTLTDMAAEATSETMLAHMRRRLRPRALRHAARAGGDRVGRGLPGRPRGVRCHRRRPHRRRRHPREPVHPRNPPGGVTVATRIAIIGAGVAGCGAARRAAELGADVMLIEQNHPGTGSSGRSAGVYNIQTLDPLDVEIRIRARELFFRLERDRGLHLSRIGNVRVATEESQLPRLQEVIDLQHQLGADDSVLLDRDGLRGWSLTSTSTTSPVACSGPTTGTSTGSSCATRSWPKPPSTAPPCGAGPRSPGTHLTPTATTSSS